VVTKIQDIGHFVPKNEKIGYIFFKKYTVFFEGLSFSFILPFVAKQTGATEA